MLLGAVGQLQFEVVQHRLKSEYDADIRLEGCQYTGARWITADTPAELRAFVDAYPARMALDAANALAFLCTSPYDVRLAQERFPEDPFPSAARARRAGAAQRRADAPSCDVHNAALQEAQRGCEWNVFAYRARAPRPSALSAALLAAGCGGGGGNPGRCSASAETCAAAVDPPAPVPAASASDQWAEICTLDGASASPRAYMDEVYLWYREIPEIDPAPYTNIGRYFHDLLTPALDSSGQLKDRFSFIVTNTDADSLLTGAITAYGVRWESDAQGRQRAAFIDEGSPAQAAGLARGAQLVEVSTPGTPDWYPNTGSAITFSYRTAPDQPTRTATMSSAVFQENPVPLVRTVTSPGGRQVGVRAVQRAYRGRAGQADRRASPALQQARGERPRAGHALQRRRLSGDSAQTSPRW